MSTPGRPEGEGTPVHATVQQAPLRPGTAPALQYVLRLGDTCLIHAQRLAEWCGRAPVLEEDIALANIALDLLGQARVLLSHAAVLDGQGHDEDALAFWRDEHDFRNLTLVELPRGDFADAVVRNLLLSTWLKAIWAGLKASADATLAGLAHKAIKEAAYHQRHAADWAVRLGRGTAESAARLAAALQRAWPYTAEMFTADAVDDAAQQAGLGPRGCDLLPAWLDEIAAVIDDAGTAMPVLGAFRSTGRLGRHSEHLGRLLCEMQHLPRSHPGAVW